MAGPADEILVKLTADASGLDANLQAAADQVAAAQEQMVGASEAAGSALAESAIIPSQAFDAMAAQIAVSTNAAKAAIAQMADAALAPLELLNEVADGTATTMDQLAAQDVALVEAFNAGTISAQAYAEAMGALDV